MIINIVDDVTNVPSGTEKDRQKKKQQIAFRRLMTGQAPSPQMREWVGMDYLEIKKQIGGMMIDGMTWNNYGSEWIVEHIVPLAYFDLMKEEDCKLAWNYNNLMPLFKNHIKMSGLTFSLLMLERLPVCAVVYELIAKTKKELRVLEKYLE